METEENRKRKKTEKNGRKREKSEATQFRRPILWNPEVKKAILGATLGIPGHSRSNSRNGTHDLIYVKALFSEQLSERLSELVGRQKFSPNSRSVFFEIGVVLARQESSARSFPAWSFSETPSGHGRPRLRVIDSRTTVQKTFFSCAPSDGEKVFEPGRPPGYPPRRPRDIPSKNFMFRLLVCSWIFELPCVGNHYLKYSWEYFGQKICIKFTFIVDNPNILGNFLLFVGQDQLGENCLTYSHIWGSQNTLGKDMRYIFGIFRPLQINHVCENSRPHGISFFWRCFIFREAEACIFGQKTTRKNRKHGKNKKHKDDWWQNLMRLNLAHFYYATFHFFEQRPEGVLAEVHERESLRKS